MELCHGIQIKSQSLATSSSSIMSATISASPHHSSGTLLVLTESCLRAHQMHFFSAAIDERQKAVQMFTLEVQSPLVNKKSSGGTFPVTDNLTFYLVCISTNKNQQPDKLWLAEESAASGQ